MFRHDSDSLLPVRPSLAKRLTGLNQLLREDLKSQLRKLCYRVSVHGTLGQGLLPAFHTRNVAIVSPASSDRSARSLVARVGPNTVFSYTLLPVNGSLFHRDAMHGTTVFPNTKGGRTTGGRYTRLDRKPAQSLAFETRNCTKPSSTNDNNCGDVFFASGELHEPT